MDVVTNQVVEAEAVVAKLAQVSTNILMNATTDIFVQGAGINQTRHRQVVARKRKLDIMSILVSMKTDMSVNFVDTLLQAHLLGLAGKAHRNIINTFETSLA